MSWIFSLVYPEEGSIAETSVRILIITAPVLQFLNLHSVLDHPTFLYFLFSLFFSTPSSCMFQTQERNCLSFKVNI